MSRLVLVLSCTMLCCPVATHAVTLSWNVSAVAVTKGKEGKGFKRVLSHAAGRATGGKLHAIIGPSGSGKVKIYIFI
jgi:ABC-type glutathione transport system ATPase component